LPAVGSWTGSIETPYALEETVMPNPEAKPRLDLIVESAVVHSFPLSEGEHTIGRGEQANIRLIDNSVSTEHARVTVRPSPDFPDVVEVVLTDANSTNGTRVNDEKISEQRLLNGDVVRIGYTVLHFCDPVGADGDTTGFIIHDGL